MSQDTTVPGDMRAQLDYEAALVRAAIESDEEVPDEHIRQLVRRECEYLGLIKPASPEPFPKWRKW